MATKQKNPIAEARDEIKSRLKGYHLDGQILIKLINRREIYIKPKFVYTTASGQKVKIRYLKDSNTIFVEEQLKEGREEVPLSALNGALSEEVKATLVPINIDEHIVIKNGALLEFLVLNSRFNKVYEIHDPKALARMEEEKTEAFDGVWYKIREKKAEDLKSVYIMATGSTLTEANDMSPSEMKMELRQMTEADPEKIREVLESRLLRPLFLYYYCKDIDGAIKLNGSTNDVQWADTKKVICTVPEGTDPAKYFARLMLEDDYIKVRERLEEIASE